MISPFYNLYRPNVLSVSDTIPLVNLKIKFRPIFRRMDQRELIQVTGETRSLRNEGIIEFLNTFTRHLTLYEIFVSNNNN